MGPFGVQANTWCCCHIFCDNFRNALSSTFQYLPDFSRRDSRIPHCPVLALTSACIPLFLHPAWGGGGQLQVLQVLSYFSTVPTSCLGEGWGEGDNYKPHVYFPTFLAQSLWHILTCLCNINSRLTAHFPLKCFEMGRTVSLHFQPMQILKEKISSQLNPNILHAMFVPWPCDRHARPGLLIEPCQRHLSCYRSEKKLLVQKRIGVLVRSEFPNFPLFQLVH